MSNKLIEDEQFINFLIKLIQNFKTIDIKVKMIHLLGLLIRHATDIVSEISI